MYTGSYIDEDAKRERQKVLKACRFILWVLMIGVSIFLASQSLVITG
ncbi:hypothetical protein IMSAGC019_02675 [Lachnospiraceae bacterium]|nr:hypothetical protein IMSAGC019_02675 [Lachnospiraceae bacterium]